jgi:hypothetical protein
MKKIRKLIDIPEKDIKQLKVIAINEGLTLKEWIEKLISKQLK